MKRLIGIAIAIALAGAALAQGAFTIRRPAEGSVVRENVLIRMPKNSIPPGGYVGIWVNGKFLEAIVPDVSGQDYVYKLDTKARGISDGKMHVEAVLYLDYAEQSRVLGRSSVDVTLDNSTSIRVPKGGFKLRYNLTAGREYLYDVEIRQTILAISDAQRKAGGRPAELPADSEKFRFLYAVDNNYSTATGREGLLRLQPLPPAGRDFAVLKINGSDTFKHYDESQMASAYMRITDTGREVFGSYPIYFPLEGTTGQTLNPLNLYGDLPLPVLPARGIKPGDSFHAAFQVGAADHANLIQMKKLSSSIDARGTLEGIEWENGIPTAKIHYIVAQGAAPAPKVAKGEQPISEGMIQLEETVWFALDRGAVTKLQLDITRDLKTSEVPGVPSGPSGPPQGGGRPDINGGGQDSSGVISSPLANNVQKKGGGGGRQAPGGGGTMGAAERPPPGGAPNGGFGPGRGGAPPVQQAQYVRIREQILMTLVK